jgi:ATP-binding cassette subfamily B protein RaxB
MQLVRVCAELAQIRTDIERMPMGYESLVGDMGSRPRILILDEGTSHSDLPNERV